MKIIPDRTYGPNKLLKKGGEKLFKTMDMNMTQFTHVNIKLRGPSNHFEMMSTVTVSQIFTLFHAGSQLKRLQVKRSSYSSNQPIGGYL